jgi:hypothetical protein
MCQWRHQLHRTPPTSLLSRRHTSLCCGSHHPTSVTRWHLSLKHHNTLHSQNRLSRRTYFWCNNSVIVGEGRGWGDGWRYNPEIRGFDSRWWQRKFYIILPAARCPWGSTKPLTEMSTRNISWGGGGGEDDLWVRLTTLPPSCADCLEIWEPQPTGNLRACPGLDRDCYTFAFTL